MNLAWFYFISLFMQVIKCFRMKIQSFCICMLWMNGYSSFKWVPKCDCLHGDWNYIKIYVAITLDIILEKWNI